MVGKGAWVLVFAFALFYTNSLVHMNLRCTREPLLAALQTAAVVVPTRSTRPVLTNVKLDVEGSTAVLSATDLEIGVRTEIEGVETTAAGSVLLPSARLMAIIRESPPGTTFEIESDGNATVVKAARSQFRLPAEDPIEDSIDWTRLKAPSIPAINKSVTVPITPGGGGVGSEFSKVAP